MNYSPSEQKKEVLNFAMAQGFADAKIVSAACDDGVDFREEPQKGCFLILFLPYGPTERSVNGSFVLSNYYPSSNKGYHLAKALAVALKKKGYDAEHTPNAKLKSLAIRSGGMRLKSGLYAHPTLGSFVTLQAIYFRHALPPDDKEAEPAAHCEICNACTHACPTGAIERGIPAYCLRGLMGQNPIPKEVRPLVFQLLGCEICQEVCPYNNEVSLENSYHYHLEELLDRSALKGLKELAGHNMARTNVVLAQAIAYAVREERADLAPLIEALSNEPLLSEMAMWALDYFHKS